MTVPEREADEGLTQDSRLEAPYVQPVLAVLTDEYMSTSVIKIRAGIPSTERNSFALKACQELERRGLAERRGSGLRSTIRWRRRTDEV